MGKNSKIIGDYAEEEAARFMFANGYVILERNWRHKNLEIDIIAQNETCIVFAEVKFRKNTHFGDPLKAVDDDKINHILKAADHYLETHEIDLNPRFDIIAITKENDQLCISHYPEAFLP